MKGRLGRPGEPSGRNASERRASLESTNAEADLWDTGKAAIAGDVSDSFQRVRRGSGGGMSAQETGRNTGSPAWWRRVTSNRRPARAGPGRVGWRRGP